NKVLGSDTSSPVSLVFIELPLKELKRNGVPARPNITLSSFAACLNCCKDLSKKFKPFVDVPSVAIIFSRGDICHPENSAIYSCFFSLNFGSTAEYKPACGGII